MFNLESAWFLFPATRQLSFQLSFCPDFIKNCKFAKFGIQVDRWGNKLFPAFTEVGHKLKQNVNELPAELHGKCLWK